MTDRKDLMPTTSGFFVSQEAPIECANPVPTPAAPAPDILRCAYMDLVVSDLQRSRDFYVDVLGLTVTEEDENAVYLRPLEEFIHHNLVLRQGPVPAVATFSYRVRTPDDLDRAVTFYSELGCRVERRADGFTKGVGDSVRVVDPLGFPYEFFHDVLHVVEERGATGLALRPVPTGRTRAARPLQPGHARRSPSREVHAGPRIPGDRRHPRRGGHGVRGMDAPQTDRARHRDDGR